MIKDMMQSLSQDKTLGISLNDRRVYMYAELT